MDVLRTPDDRFARLHDWSYEARYADVGGLRMAYVDEGPPDAAPVLLLHGEPTWSYLYRKVIPPLVAAGHRVVAPDLIGFGRSDKPAAVEDHSYQAHVDWTAALVAAAGLHDVTLVAQDWGGLIGLRLVAEDPDRYAAVVAANTGLPTGDHTMPDAWWKFRNWVEHAERLPVGFLVNSGCHRQLPEHVVAAYNAPFPDETYKAGPRALPLLVPTLPDDPASEPNQAAWQALEQWHKPFLCLFSDGDPVTAGMRRVFLKLIPGAAELVHPVIADAGHFLQEDAGEQLGVEIVRFLAAVNG